MSDRFNFSSIRSKFVVRSLLVQGFLIFLSTWNASKAVTASSLDSDTSHLPNALGLIELMAQNQGDPKLVIKHGEQALLELKKNSDHNLCFTVRQQLSASELELGNNRAAIEHANAALAISRKLGKQDEIANSLYALALAQYYAREATIASTHAERACKFQRELNDDKKLAKTLRLLGAIHRSRSAFKEAILCHQESLEVSRRMLDAAGVAKAQNNIGLIYWKMDQHSRALEHLTKALNYFREHGNTKHLIVALSNVGLVHNELEQPGRALELLHESLHMLQQTKSGPSRQFAKVLSNIAFAHDILEDRKQAMFFYVRALQMRRELKDKWGCSRTLGSIGKLLADSGRHEEAIDKFEEALAFAKKCEARDEQIHLCKHLAESLEAIGRPRQALELFKESLRINRELEIPEVARKIAEIEASAVIAAKNSAWEALSSEFGRHRIKHNWLITIFSGLLLMTGAVLMLNRSRATRLQSMTTAPACLRNTEERTKLKSLETGGIEHDLRNALSAVLNLISIARVKSKQGKEFDQILERAKLAGDQVDRLASKLVESVNENELELKNYDVEKLLVEAVELGCSESSPEIEFLIATDLPNLCVDKGQFNQIISNLVINANQAMGERGRLTVRAKKARNSPHGSSVADAVDYLCIEIEDNGPGIASELCEKVMQPYFTTKESGTGLGLPTAFSLVKHYGGSIEFQSRPGDGTTFSIYLPISERSERGQAT